MRAVVLFWSMVTVACGGIIDGGVMGADGAASVDGGSDDIGVQLPTTCPALTACGGSLSGTWDYKGACIDNAVSKLKGDCPTADIQNAMGTVQGFVKFEGTTVLRSLTSSITATVVLPPACTSGASCSTVQAMLPPGTTCTGTSGTCHCTVTNTDSISDSDTYSLQGNKLVTGGGGQYDYCVSGNTLKYTDTDKYPQYHGTFSLTKR